MPKMRFILLTGFCLYFAATVQAEQKPRTLQDLEALRQRKAWFELIVGLRDIPPAERKASWNRLVEDACLRDDTTDDIAEYCQEELMTVLASEPDNKDFAWKAGRWARLHLQHWAAVPFFANALKAGDPRCADPDVEMAVLAGLSLPAGTNKDIVQKGRTVAFDTCWGALQGPVTRTLSADNSYFSENTCPDLKKKSVLKGLKARLCESSKS